MFEGVFRKIGKSHHHHHQYFTDGFMWVDLQLQCFFIVMFTIGHISNFSFILHLIPVLLCGQKGLEAAVTEHLHLPTPLLTNTPPSPPPNPPTPHPTPHLPVPGPPSFVSRQTPISPQPPFSPYNAVECAVAPASETKRSTFSVTSTRGARVCGPTLFLFNPPTIYMFIICSETCTLFTLICMPW